MFWVLKRTFGYQQHKFCLRNKKNNVLVHTLNLSSVSNLNMCQGVRMPCICPVIKFMHFVMGQLSACERDIHTMHIGRERE